MEKVYYKDIIKALSKYKEILQIVNENYKSKEAREVGNLIQFLEPFSDTLIKNTKDNNGKKNSSTAKKKNSKVDFVKATEQWLNKEFQNIKGVKLDYTKFRDREAVIDFINNNNNEEVLKSTTLLDLNLLYFILCKDKTMIKKKKDEVYSIIVRFIRAGKQGEAFNKLV